jgi:hypothetical protein
MAIHTLASDLPVWEESLSAPAESELHSIPSQTTRSEREFLFWFFSKVWAGQGPVCEVGPWLGGTTRAIAEGMLANPRRAVDTRFWSFDKFENYSTAEVLLGIGAPLVEKGLLGGEDLQRCAETRDFLELFRTLHRGRRYMEGLLQVERRVLPHEEGAALGEERELDLSEWAGRFPVVFVDGCKSWYSTRFLMKQVTAAAEPGDWIIFQDHLWRTCYWLPCFTWLMRDALEPCFQTGTTLCLRWTRKVDPAEVEARMPTAIGSGDALWLLRLFAEYGNMALDRGNQEMAYALKLQGAAAMTAVGEVALANHLLLSAAREVFPFDPWRRILESLVKPTYDAVGRAFQLNEPETAKRLLANATQGLPSFWEREELKQQSAKLVKVEGQLAEVRDKLRGLKQKLEGRKLEEEKRKNRRWTRRLKSWFKVGA